MPYKSPVENRTPRNIAVELGSPATFVGGESMYDPSAGVPASKSGGKPADNVGATFGKATVIPQPAPFTNLKSAPGGKE